MSRPTKSSYTICLEKLGFWNFLRQWQLKRLLLQAEEGKGRQTRGKKISYSESARGFEDSEESEEDKKPKSQKKAKKFSDDDTEEEFEANDEVSDHFFHGRSTKKASPFYKIWKKFWRDVKRTFFVPSVAWKKWHIDGFRVRKRRRTKKKAMTKKK